METKKYLKLFGQAQQSHQVCNDVNDDGNADDHGEQKLQIMISMISMIIVISA